MLVKLLIHAKQKGEGLGVRSNQKGRGMRSKKHPDCIVEVSSTLIDVQIYLLSGLRMNAGTSSSSSSSSTAVDLASKCAGALSPFF